MIEERSASGRQPVRGAHPAALATVWSVSLALLLTIGPSCAGAETLLLGPGSDLQAALNRARPGDVLLLQAGTTFVGNYVLPPPRGGDDNRTIIIRSSVSGPELPGPSARIQPSHAPLLPRLQSPNEEPALRTAPGARRWRVEYVEFGPNVGGAGDIIRLGDGSSAQTDLALVPRDLVLDHVYVHGDPTSGQKRGLALNSGDTRVMNSWFADIKARGQDSQAIAGWNGPGPYVVVNNYLESAGQGFMLGGADPSIPGLVPTDIVFVGNLVRRPSEWRDGPWQVKNLFELKNARQVRIEGNVFEYNWRAAQPGYAILFTPRNQDGRAPWSTVEDVLFRYNVVRHAGGAINILGRDRPNTSGPCQRVAIVDNLFYDIDGRGWGGSGDFLLVGEGPSALLVEHNTIFHSGKLVSAYGGTRTEPTAAAGFTFRYNVARHNQYGVHGSDRGVGNDTLNAYFPSAVFRRNVLAGGVASQYPPDNLFPPASDFERLFSDLGNGDFRLNRAAGVIGWGDDETLGAAMERVVPAWQAALHGTARWTGRREERRSPPRLED